MRHLRPLELIRTRAAHEQRGQSGVSLLEVLVGVGVMVPLTFASVMGLQLEMKTSSSTQRRQKLEVALTAATEDLKSLPYLSCGTAAEYQKVYDSWDGSLGTELRKDQRPAAPKITFVHYWQHGKDAFVPSCGGDDGAQRLEVTVTDGDVEATGTVVKRDENARVGNSG